MCIEYMHAALKHTSMDTCFNWTCEPFFWLAQT